jgi:hypothetical protein
MKPIKFISNIIKLKASNEIEDLNSAPAGANQGLSDLRRQRRKPRALKPKPVIDNKDSIFNMSDDSVKDMMKQKPVKAPDITDNSVSKDMDDFGVGTIGEGEEVGQGINGARKIKIGKKNYIAKNDPDSIRKEALAHEIGKEFGMPVPKTGIKLLPHHETGEMLPHSIQEMVPGVTGGEYRRQMRDYGGYGNVIPNLQSHPGMAKTALGDYVLGNTDRHSQNYMYDPRKNEVHAIDNGYAFTSDDHPDGIIKSNLSEMKHDMEIPEDFRQGILNADPDKHADLIRQHHANAHRGLTGQEQEPHHIEHVNHSRVEPYLSRLNKMKTHMSNPKIKTMGDIYNALYGRRI